MKASNILGMNARSRLYTGIYNTRKGKKIADSKIQTDRVLRKAGVAKPDIYIKFRNVEKVYSFDWDSLPNKFALKPSRGLGGDGIIVVKKKLESGLWVTSSKQKITTEDLKLHTMDILEGAYSMGNEPDVAFVQEFVGRHKAFRKYAFRGTPDIRIVVFNKIPVMAMIRLPTKESGGRANIHQGAIAVGIDIATGITTKAIWHGEQIVYKPDTKRKLRGIKIPRWDDILKMSVEAQIASTLLYCGVDIVLHPEKGPMIIEINAQPGLQIQMANMDGLQKRLSRVDDMEVRDVDHGVKIAKALFTGKFSYKVQNKNVKKVLNSVETIKIYGYKNGKRVSVEARVDTGARRSSIDRSLAKDLGLINPNNILWKEGFAYRSATGLQSRPVVSIIYVLAGKKIVSSASIADRSRMKNPFLVGRLDMRGFLVKPE
ncbi:hypothetical protein ISR94_00100 [Candidatus Microgenomates bacterium]|nr:hypothetical protein [Candidatus Microgenomates bacterium]